MRARTLASISAGLALLVCLAAAKADKLRAGEYFWEPEISPSGPVVVIISLPDQTLSAYRNGLRVAYSSISSGTKGRSTPAGVFTILEKEVTHFSNKYHHAPMPFMQRLTWQGVAIHGGDLPGYPASHGCIRLPREFAQKLYTLTTRGTTVIVLDEKYSEPTFAANPGILLGPSDDGSPDLPSGAYQWNPERSNEGPITILASGADKTVYVYRNGIPIGRAALEVDDPAQPLGSHAYTMLDGVAETASAFVPGRPGHRWMVVKTDSKKRETTLDELGRRMHVSAEFAGKIYDVITPGTTIVVTDAPALSGPTSKRAVQLMEEERK